MTSQGSDVVHSTWRCVTVSLYILVTVSNAQRNVLEVHPNPLFTNGVNDTVTCVSTEQLTSPVTWTLLTPLANDQMSVSGPFGTQLHLHNLDVKLTPQVFLQCSANISGSAMIANGVVIVDVDECAENPDICLDRGYNLTSSMCVNTLMSLDCVCRTGYVEGSTERCRNVDECASGQHNCSGQAQCEDTQGSYLCQCQAGFSFDGTDCIPDDLCTQVLHNCEAQNATCIGNRTDTRCACATGYTKLPAPSSMCMDVDECTDGLHNCPTASVCSNTMGSFQCNCMQTGFVVKSIDAVRQCADDNECLSQTPGPCASTAVCNNTIGSFTCACTRGHTGDGLTCSDVNECALNSTCNAGPGVLCFNTPGSFRCVCDFGYRRNHTTCNEVDECSEGTHNCGVTSVCRNTPGNFTCDCIPGFSSQNGECVQATTSPVATFTSSALTSNSGIGTTTATTRPTTQATTATTSAIDATTVGDDSTTSVTTEPTSPTSTPTQAPSRSSDKGKTYVIIGAVCGGAVVLGVIIFVIISCVRRRNRLQRKAGQQAEMQVFKSLSSSNRSRLTNDYASFDDHRQKPEEDAYYAVNRSAYLDDSILDNSAAFTESSQVSTFAAT